MKIFESLSPTFPHEEILINFFIYIRDFGGELALQAGKVCLFMPDDVLELGGAKVSDIQMLMAPDLYVSSVPHGGAFLMDHCEASVRVD